MTKTDELKIGVIGNCQAQVVAECMAQMSGIGVRRIPLTQADKFDLVFAQKPFLPKTKGKVVYYPRITFPAHSPDAILITSRNKPLQSPLRDLNSAIVAKAWLEGLTVKQTENLFNEYTFDQLGFFEMTAGSIAKLLQEGDDVGIPLHEVLENAQAQGNFMHTFNHPHGSFLAKVCELALQKAGVKYQSLKNPPDLLSRHAIWPLYPEIAERLGMKGEYKFKMDDRDGGDILDLHDFIDYSFALYEKWGDRTFTCARLQAPRFANFRRLSPGSHPYKGLPEHQYWRFAVKPEVDPVVEGAFVISRKDKVATAGSCFAQHISNSLKKVGFNYLVAEKDPGKGGANYGVFSARYGNLYTARQLLQLVERAYGRFRPLESVWTKDDRFVDPFRPEIEPNGFETAKALEDSRAIHFAAVRKMLEELDVLVFTLGLTEAWRSRRDGAVFPIAPGVSGGVFHPGQHEFHNFSVAEVVSDLELFLFRMRKINPRARVILTVSPVPLAATFEHRNVIVSTTYSKSVLRVAADEIARKYANVAYFPSYEIITGNYTRGAYYDETLRNVTPEGVSNVMKLFLKHYTSSEPVKSIYDQAIEIVCEEAKLMDAS